MQVLCYSGVLFLLVILVQSDYLDDALEEYELLDEYHFTHRIVKRSLDTGRTHTRQLNFNALGREFRLFLQRKPINNKFKIYAVNGKNQKRPLNLDIELYEGYDLAEPDGSSVSAIWDDKNSLTAVIRSKNDTYSIEPSWRFSSNSSSTTLVAYKKSKVKMLNDLGPSYCGFITPEGYDHAPFNSADSRTELTESSATRDKRASNTQTSSNSNQDRNTCHLLLVADYRFYENMGQGSFVKTSSYLIGLIDRVDAIYRETKFGNFRGMGFEIAEMLIHEEPTNVSEIRGNQHYNQRTDVAWDTRELLEVFSRPSRYKAFCLAHLFTYQPFSGGVLGLAYIGSPRTHSVGGVCSPVYHKGAYALYLNTGWSSSLNHYNRRLLTQEADLVTTHEFGHNWGSEHDPDTTECSPDSSGGGKYIMYTYSVSGYDENNKIFSPCSRRSIGNVLQKKASGCFKVQSREYCGNSLVEGEEECDGGHGGGDACCDANCLLREGAVCSDNNDFCCEGCQFANTNKVCHADLQSNTSCEGESFCTGLSSECPEPSHKPDGTSCIERGECRQGSCIPFCETQNLISCICDSIEDSCKWCCKSSHTSMCEPFLTAGETSYLSNGMPCVYGFCNEEGVCEKQVQDLVQRLWQIIEDLSADSLVAFMRANIVGTVIVLSLLLWIPGSIVVSCVDRSRRKREDAAMEWRHARSDQLYYDKASQNGTMKSRKFVNARIRDVGEVNGAPIHIGPNRGASTYI